MKGDKKAKFAAGQADSEGVPSAVKEAICAAAPEGSLSCAAAFEIVARTGRPPADIGRAADRLQISLVKCQLGLFGYTPDKKIVNAAPAMKPELAAAIQEKLQNGRLACSQAWDLAITFNLPRMAVSAACEALGVKIKPCQLGAF
jgi:hypothetical protein